MALNMAESCTDIQKYTNIIDGKFLREDQVIDSPIDLGTSTGGASVGDTYVFENGLRQAQIIGENDNVWIVEHGLREHSFVDKCQITKKDMSTMIKSGEMVLITSITESDELLVESTESNTNELQEFIDGVDRYLLINEGKESQNYTFNWKLAWEEGKTPIEAAEEAILEEN